MLAIKSLDECLDELDAVQLVLVQLELLEGLQALVCELLGDLLPFGVGAGLSFQVEVYQEISALALDGGVAALEGDAPECFNSMQA